MDVNAPAPDAEAVPDGRDAPAAEPASLGVSIVMPCLNEAQTLSGCIAQAQEALAAIAARYELTGEVVIADNGSTDGSQRIAREAGARVVDVSVRGYGAALAAGMEAARGRFLVMGDSDGSYDFRESVEMIGELIAGADLCMGSRFKGEIKPNAMPWKNRYIGNPVLSGLLRLMFGARVSDSHCGLRALTKDTFHRLSLSSTGMEFASEMVIKAVLHGVRIAERPVTLSPDGRDRPPHLRPWRDGWRHLRFMFMLCPAWLFFLPAAILAVVGSVIAVTLLLQADQTMAVLGPFRLGDHWMIGATAMMTIGHQLAMLGLVALVHAFTEGVRIPSPAMRRALASVRLEHFLVVGGALAIGAVLWLLAISLDWASAGFGGLDATRPFLFAFTVLTIGAQTFFGAFMISIVAGAQAGFDHLTAGRDTAPTRPD